MIPQPHSPDHATTPTTPTAPLARPAPVIVPADWAAFWLTEPTRAIRQYTRTDAILDRVLLEVPRRVAALHHLPWPTAITAAVWADTIAWPPAAEGSWPWECESARLAEVLHHLPATLPAEGESARFFVWRVDPATPQARPQQVDLTVTVEMGDCLETVATIAHTHETDQ